MRAGAMATASASAPVTCVTLLSACERLGASRDGVAPRGPRVPRRHSKPDSSSSDVVGRHRRRARSHASVASIDRAPGDPEPRKIAVIGAGFAGVAAAYHILLRCAEGLDDPPATATADASASPSSSRRPVEVHLFDEKGIAGGASGVAAGLLHPYTPRGKIIWKGVDGVAATLSLVAAAEDAERRLDSGAATLEDDEATTTTSTAERRRGEAIAWRKGTVRPARNLKQARDLARFAPASATAGGEGVAIDCNRLRAILPGVDVPEDVANPIAFIEKEMEEMSKLNSASERRRAAERSASPAAAALHIPEGVVLDSNRYLSALWNATRLLAASNATPAGCVARLHVGESIGSLRDERVRGYDAVVVACGAAAGSIAELSSAGTLPTTLQGGHVVELVPAAERDSPWDESSPGILGAPYVAPLSARRLLVGTTKEFGATVEDARRAGPVDPGADSAAETAAAELVAKASATYPPIEAMDVDIVRYGVRANPPRTPAGSLPLVGRIDGGGDGDGAGSRWWFVGGLGARGLVYHAMLGAHIAEAVARGDPDVIPEELRFDPKVVDESIVGSAGVDSGS